MKKTPMVKSVVSLFVIALATAAGVVSAQTAPQTGKKVNSPFTSNPKTKLKSVGAEDAGKSGAISTNETVSGERDVETVTDNPITENKEFESRSVASKTLEVVKRANATLVSPTEIYKVGAGDVLFINLQNAAAKGSAYFTVLNDGTIDYPLAGEMIQVGGLTVEEIEDHLKSKIKLYENPQISVRVREHASHAVTILGAVEKPGALYLKREAMPLFIIRAEAVAQSKADSVTIKRHDGQTEQINLRDAKSDDVLIFPGDILEFKSAAGNYAGDSASRQFYFIGGSIQSAGQKDFYPGLSLTQAILASGGLKKSNVKRVVIRRQNREGLLSPIEFDLNAIKNGKQPDPQINAGDTIEIGN